LWVVDVEKQNTGEKGDAPTRPKARTNGMSTEELGFDIYANDRWSKSVSKDSVKSEGAAQVRTGSSRERIRGYITSELSAPWKQWQKWRPALKRKASKGTGSRLVGGKGVSPPLKQMSC